MCTIIADLYNPCCNQKTADYFMVNLTAPLIEKIKEAQTLVLENAWFAIEFGSAQGAYLTTDMLTEIDTSLLSPFKTFLHIFRWCICLVNKSRQLSIKLLKS